MQALQSVWGRGAEWGGLPLYPFRVSMLCQCIAVIRPTPQCLPALTEVTTPPCPTQPYLPSPRYPPYSTLPYPAPPYPALTAVSRPYPAGPPQPYPAGPPRLYLPAPTLQGLPGMTENVGAQFSHTVQSVNGMHSVRAIPLHTFRDQRGKPFTVCQCPVPSFLFQCLYRPPVCFFIPLPTIVAIPLPIFLTDTVCIRRLYFIACVWRLYSTA